MNTSLPYTLEWANYARTAYFTTVVPSLEVTLSRQVVLVTDPEVPSVDGNHAALLRCLPEEADALLERVVRHYQERRITPYVVLSPACSPSDWPQRLAARGFKPYGGPETWMHIEQATRAERLQVPAYLEIRKVASDAEITDFCRLVLETFEMPEEMLPVMERGLGPINALEGVENYVARIDGKPVGCASLYHYLGYTAMGSAGVLPGMRFMGIAAGLMGHLYRAWKQAGTRMLLVQTSLPKLEQIFTFGGGEKLFERRYYVLED
jgi:hypothetical protein